MHGQSLEAISKRPLSKAALICPIPVSPMSGIFDLTLDKIEHFETASLIRKYSFRYAHNFRFLLRAFYNSW